MRAPCRWSRVRHVGNVFSNTNLKKVSCNIHQFTLQGAFYLQEPMRRQEQGARPIRGLIIVSRLGNISYLSWNKRGNDGGKGLVLTWKPRKQIDRWTWKWCSGHSTVLYFTHHSIPGLCTGRRLRDRIWSEPLPRPAALEPSVSLSLYLETFCHASLISLFQKQCI